jgi:hypothetical protein
VWEASCVVVDGLSRAFKERLGRLCTSASGEAVLAKRTLVRNVRGLPGCNPRFSRGSSLPVVAGLTHFLHGLIGSSATPQHHGKHDNANALTRRSLQ